MKLLDEAVCRAVSPSRQIRWDGWLGWLVSGCAALVLAASKDGSLECLAVEESSLVAVGRAGPHGKPVPGLHQSRCAEKGLTVMVRQRETYS